jgi:hypothetical protein
MVLEITIDYLAFVLRLVSQPQDLAASMIRRVFEMLLAWPSVRVVG